MDLQGTDGNETISVAAYKVPTKTSVNKKKLQQFQTVKNYDQLSQLTLCTLITDKWLIWPQTGAFMDPGFCLGLVLKRSRQGILAVECSSATLPVHRPINNEYFWYGSDLGGCLSWRLLMCIFFSGTCLGQPCDRASNGYHSTTSIPC